MVSARLQWSPTFEVGQRSKLDSVYVDTTVPAVPVSGQTLWVRAYNRTEDDSWEELGDRYAFHIGKVEYFLEGVGNPIEVIVTLRLDNQGQEFEEHVLDVLLQKYGWKADE